MHFTLKSSLFGAIALASSASAATWTLSDQIDSSNWLTKFNFYTGADPTHGHGLYVDQSTALNSGIASSDDSSFTIKVDQAQNVDARNTVRLESSATYTDGVYVLQVSHIPTGCSVWPAWWTLTDESRGSWPNGGEIDVLEYFSGGLSSDLVSLHTVAGCSATNPGDMSGTPGASSNCEGNQGCNIQLPGDASDSSINAAGGATVVMERAWGSTGNGVRVWSFKNGSNLPFDAGSDSIDVSSLGEPDAHFPRSDGCNDLWSPHKLVLNIALCGDAVPETGGNYASCTAQYGTCLAQVQNHGDSYGDAYWTVKSIRVYTNGGGSDKAN